MLLLCSRLLALSVIHSAWQRAEECGWELDCTFCPVGSWVARALQPPPAACSVLDCPVPGQTTSPRAPRHRLPSSASGNGRECCVLGQKDVVCVWFWLLLRVLSGSMLLDSSAKFNVRIVLSITVLFSIGFLVAFSNML